jgi:hypothetical protein
LPRVLAYPKLAAIFDELIALIAAVSEAADTVDPAERVAVLVTNQTTACWKQGQPGGPT